MSSLDLELEKEKALALSATLPEEATSEASPSGDDEEDSTFMEGLATPFVAVAESVPGAKQIGSAINATIDVAVADEDTETFSEAYFRNLDSVNETVDDLKNKNPITFHGTDFAVQAGLAATAGAAGKGYAGARGILAAEGALGGLNALSRTREKDNYDRLTTTVGGTVLGATFSALGTGATNMFTRFSKGLKNISDKSVITAVSPKEGAKFLRKTNNLIKNRYNDDLNLAAKHADEIINSTPVATSKGVAENASLARKEIGEEIGYIIDEIDESALILRGSNKTKDGGILQAELKNAVGGSSRFKSFANDELAPQLDQIDEFIDSVTLTTKTTHIKGTKIRKQVPKNDGSGGFETVEELMPSPEPEIVARQLSPKEIFDIKIQTASRIEDVFEKKILDAGSSMSHSQAATLRKQKAKMVGKLSDILDRQVTSIAEESGNPETIARFRELNKKYALANHLEEAAQDTVSTQAGTASEVFKNFTSMKGLMIAGAAGVSGNPVVALGVLTAQAIAKTPGASIKSVRALQKLSNFAQQFPEDPIVHAATVAIMNTSNPEDMQKQIGGYVAEISLIQNAVARDTDAVRLQASNISAVIRNKIGDEAASQFNEILRDGSDSDLAGFMDGLSKDPATKRLIKPGLGFNDMVFSEEDKMALESEIRNSRLPAGNEIILIEQLRNQGTIPQIEQPEPFRRPFTPRDRSKHRY